jgi:hypothetical protein
MAKQNQQNPASQAEVEALEGYVEVFFKKSPTGSPFFLSYNVGESGMVSEKMVEDLTEAGII